jgi:AhpD family alkylhydroperoxidase
MQARMTNPALIVPDVMPTLQGLAKTLANSGLPLSTLDLVYLRASQINNVSFSIEMHTRSAKQAGESDERLLMVSAWRDSTYFDDAERAALALTEAVTRLNDGPDTVSDDLWEQVSKHYAEGQLAALLVAIATVNFWNRLNAPTRQVAGAA